MISRELKLRLRPAQERLLERWLWHLTSVYNWAVRTIELDAKSGIHHTRYGLESKLVGHSKTLGIPARVLESTARTAHDARQRHLEGLAGPPRLKGRRNRLNSLLWRGPVALHGRKVRIPGLGVLRFHQQDVPEGRIKQARVIRRASGWYLTLFIDAEPMAVPVLGQGEVGIDPGFASLLTLSTGEKVDHPHELQQTAVRLAQAQRGRRKHLTARLLERQLNQRRDRNHKLSRRLVAENALIAWSKDPHRVIARRFGKSVASAAHGQLRSMLAYKCSRTGGRQFVEVSHRYSTVTCSACLTRSGPTGFAGLSIRQWVCPVCGTEHDRDVNAALNTLKAGRGARLESAGDSALGIAI